MSVRGAIPAELTRYHLAAQSMEGGGFLRSAFGAAFSNGAGADNVADALQREQFENGAMRFVRSGDVDPAAAGAFLNRGNLGLGEPGLALVKGKEKDADALFSRLMLYEQMRQMRERIQIYDEMARWYGEQIQKADRDIEKLEAIREKASAFLNDVDDIDAEFNRTGKFNREKNIEALKKRGVDVKPDASDAELRRALDRQKEADRKIVEDANRLIESRKAERDEYRRKKDEYEQKAKDGRAKTKEIENSGDLNPQEKSVLVGEALKNEEPKVVYDIGNFENDKKKKIEINAKIKDFTENERQSLATNALNEDSESAPDVSSKTTAIFNNSANPKYSEITPPEISLPETPQRVAMPGMSK